MGHTGVRRLLAVVLGISAVVATSTLGLGSGYAASANMYLSAYSNTVSRDHTLAVGVRINSGSDNINAVQANLTYPTDKFDFVSIASSSAFPVESESNGGNGTIRIGRGVIGSVKGDQLIATITFKAKAVGAAAVSFTSGSSATESSNGKIVTITTAGAQYTITDSSALVGSGAAHDVIPPKITEVKVSDVNYSSVRLTWKTSEPAQSEVSYGSTTAYGITSVDSNFVTDHSMVISSDALMPATPYHFKITNKDTAGNVASSSDATFTTKGSVIVVRVIGSGKQALHASVTVDKLTSKKTDRKGYATFINLPAGTHKVVATSKDKTASADVVTTIPQDMPASLTLQLDISPVSMLTVLFMILLLALLATAIAKQLKKSKKVNTTTHATEEKVVSDKPKTHTTKHKKP